MVGFIVGGPPEQLKKVCDAASEMMGFAGPRIGPYPGTVILQFEDRDSAQRAQWMIEANGAEGRKIHERTDEILPE